MNANGQVASPNLELVKQLQSLLAMAERGQLTSLAAVAVDAQNNDITTIMVTDPQIAFVNVGLDQLKQFLMNRRMQLAKQAQLSPILRAGQVPPMPPPGPRQ